MKRRIRSGNIVKVYDDSNLYRLARVVDINYSTEQVMVVYLDELFNDLELDSTSIMKIRLYEGLMHKEWLKFLYF